MATVFQASGYTVSGVISIGSLPVTVPGGQAWVVISFVDQTVGFFTAGSVVSVDSGHAIVCVPLASSSL